MKKEKHGFTFVELVISIIILAILSLLGFIGYSKNLEDSRDAQRKSDFSSLIEAFKLHKTNRSTYPYPTGVQVNILNNTKKVALQGTLGKNVILSTIDKIPLDPYIKIPYTYSITFSMNEFQIAGTLENNGNNLAILDGDYESVSKNILPTIVLAHKQGDIEINPADLDGAKNRNKFVFDNQKYNLPYTFNLPYNPSSGSIQLELIMADKNIAYLQKNTYKNCNEIVSAGKFIGTGVYQVNKYGILKSVQCEDQIYPESCKEILEKNPLSPSGVYYILPKGLSEKILVYCDMETAGGGWTLMAKNGSSFNYKIGHCDFMEPPSSVSIENQFMYWACDLGQKEILFWTPTGFIRGTNNKGDNCAINVTKTNNNECTKTGSLYQTFKILEKGGCMGIGDTVNLSEWSFWWKGQDFETNNSKNLSYLTGVLQGSCDTTNKSYCNLFDIYSMDDNGIGQTYGYRGENCKGGYIDGKISIRSHSIFVR